MIVDNRAQEVESFGTQTAVEMGIDTEALVHVMAVLTNIYSNPVGAIVRELLSNALDAQKSIGKGDTEIEVTLPTSNQPTYTLRDFGPGLSEEDVYGIFGRYGNSTKRQSNLYNGQLGIGGKSPFTLVSSWILKSINGGLKKTYFLSLNAKGIPTISLADTTVTDEPSGLQIEIEIPKDKIWNFTVEFNTFLEFFDGSVRVKNSSQPKRFDRSGKSFLGGTVFSHASHRVVMGGVVYPVDLSKLPHRGGLLAGKNPLVVFAKTGAVNFVPSREALSYDFKTVGFLEDLYARLDAELNTELEALLGHSLSEPMSLRDLGIAYNFLREKNVSILTLANLPTRYRGSYISAVVLNPRGKTQNTEIRYGTQFFALEHRVCNFTHAETKGCKIGRIPKSVLEKLILELKTSDYTGTLSPAEEELTAELKELPPFTLADLKALAETYNSRTPTTSRAATPVLRWKVNSAGDLTSGKGYGNLTTESLKTGKWLRVNLSKDGDSYELSGKVELAQALGYSVYATNTIRDKTPVRLLTEWAKESLIEELSLSENQSVLLTLLIGQGKIGKVFGFGEYCQGTLLCTENSEFFTAKKLNYIPRSTETFDAALRLQARIAHFQTLHPQSLYLLETLGNSKLAARPSLSIPILNTIYTKEKNA